MDIQRYSGNARCAENLAHPDLPRSERSIFASLTPAEVSAALSALAAPGDLLGSLDPDPAGFWADEGGRQ